MEGRPSARPTGFVLHRIRSRGEFAAQLVEANPTPKVARHEKDPAASAVSTWDSAVSHQRLHFLGNSVQHMRSLFQRDRMPSSTIWPGIVTIESRPLLLRGFGSSGCISLGSAEFICRTDGLLVS